MIVKEEAFKFLYKLNSAHIFLLCTDMVSGLSVTKAAGNSHVGTEKREVSFA